MNHPTLMKYILLTIGLLNFCQLFASPGFPQENWRKCKQQDLANLSSEKVDQLFDYAFDSTASYQITDRW